MLKGRGLLAHHRRIAREFLLIETPPATHFFQLDTLSQYTILYSFFIFFNFFAKVA
jgi:hypothetical protein